MIESRQGHLSQREPANGRELCRRFFTEAVQPILQQGFPDLAYDAAQLDAGSDTLGYDDMLSTDQHWGLKVFLYVSEKDLVEVADSIHALLRERLPISFEGWTTSYIPSPKDDKGVMIPETLSSGPVNHWVTVWTVPRFCEQPWNLGIDATADLTTEDWMRLPEHSLLRLTRGPVFHEGLGELGSLRRNIAFYPMPVWARRMAALWRQIADEEEFVSRCGQVGDAIGSRIVASRQIERIMRLGFLMERRYAPYAKWLGTAFQELDCAPALTDCFEEILSATEWKAREDGMCRALAYIGGIHNKLGLTPWIDSEPRRYHDRPFRFLDAGRFAQALESAPTVPPAHPPQA